MSYLDRIRACNNFDPSGFRPFEVDGLRVGWIRHDNAERLSAFGDVFAIEPAVVRLQPALDEFERRTAAVAPVMAALSAAGVLPKLRGEPYPITPRRALPALLRIDRAACPFLGARAYGVHMNGYVRKPDGLHLWVARRAADKMNYPGMLDNMVAGGQPFGLGLMENLIKECGEEAGIPAALACQAVPVGLIAYDHQFEDGAKPDWQYCYDLELPVSFEPVAADGEVGEFMLWPIERVAETVRETTEFKFNCNLVIIDFLIRQGVLNPDNEPDYGEICAGLRQGSAL